MSKNKYLGANGVRLTKQLFIEYDYVSDRDYAVYSISREDKEVNGKTYPSLYRLYMETNDVTEAKFVNLYLYDWEQWEKLQKQFGEEIELWRQDLRHSVTSEMVGLLLSDARSESKSSMASAKYLLDNILKSGKRVKQGRPSNKEGQTDFSVDKEVVADLERIRSAVGTRKD